MVKMAWRKIKQKGEEERSRGGFLFPPSSQERPRQQSRMLLWGKSVAGRGTAVQRPWGRSKPDSADHPVWLGPSEQGGQVGKTREEAGGLCQDCGWSGTLSELVATGGAEQRSSDGSIGYSVH